MTGAISGAVPAGRPQSSRTAAYSSGAEVHRSVSERNLNTETREIFPVRQHLVGALHARSPVTPRKKDRGAYAPVAADLGDHLVACVAAGAAPAGDDLFEAVGGELCRERR
jgi:hypothetical protein